MTQQRRDSYSTEFGLWLRQQPEIDSKFGYITTNLDYIWQNYETKKFMCLEEKRKCSKFDEIQFPQSKLFRLIHKLCEQDEDYQGFYFLKFEGTSPKDGPIWIELLFTPKRQIVEVSEEQLNEFMQSMQLPEENPNEIEKQESRYIDKK